MVHKKQRMGLYIAATAIVVIVVMYLLCVFKPYGWCPDYCNVASGSSGSDGDGNETDTSGVCPPVNDKLRDRVPTLVDAFQTTCNIGGYEFIDGDYALACERNDDDSPEFDCMAFEDNNLYQVMKGECEDIPDAEWRCQPSWVGCYCAGTHPFPDDECDTVYYGGKLRCDGTCDTLGYECQGTPGYCECDRPPGDEEEFVEGSCLWYDDQVSNQQIDIKMCYAGDCPDREYCYPNYETWGCECVSQVLIM